MTGLPSHTHNIKNKTMKLSEKYIAKINSNLIKGKELYTIAELATYGDIRFLEAQQTLLVSNPAIASQEKYIDKLSEIVNSLQKIAEIEEL